MKKLLVASAVALAMTSSANAESKKEESWVGGFFEYYSTDHAESIAPNFLDNGKGFGIEYGFKFKPEWAFRLEYSALDINASPDDVSGNRFGVDALYFLNENQLYAFAGVKRTKIVESDMMFNLGLGKHWDVNENLKVITEVAGYQNLDSGNNDVSFKLGLAYSFGGSSAPAQTSQDNDKDGVVNSKDLCANTPYGTQVDATGCAIVAKATFSDSDKDGIADSKDKCANTPRTDKVDATGCSVFEEEKVSVDIKVLFDHNSSVINNPSDPQFQEFADFMKRFPSTDAVIEGHASAPGSESYNMMLSEKRAKAVRKLLVENFGIDASRISAVGYGETRLLDTSNTAAAHIVNRRITGSVEASKKVKATK